MLRTLHSCSALGVKSDLELFDVPPTQFSHESHEFLEFHPLAAKPDESDTVEFRIPNTGKFYINPSAIFFYVKAKIVHANGGSLSHRSRRQAKVEGSTAQSASATTQSGSTTQNTTQ